jgi:hypothetical protein
VQVFDKVKVRDLGLISLCLENILRKIHGIHNVQREWVSINVAKTSLFFEVFKV